MVWNKVNMEKQRKNFIIAVKEGTSLANACRLFDISRTTSYKWLGRWDENGDNGLIDLSRIPHRNPRIISEKLENEIISIHLKYPGLGPRKIYAKLKELDREEQLPCASTIGNIFDRNGLTVKRKYRIRVCF